MDWTMLWIALVTSCLSCLAYICSIIEKGLTAHPHHMSMSAKAGHSRSSTLATVLANLFVFSSFRIHALAKEASNLCAQFPAHSEIAIQCTHVCVSRGAVYDNHTIHCECQRRVVLRDHSLFTKQLQLQSAVADKFVRMEPSRHVKSASDVRIRWH
jgi:hypothetical protein